MITTIDPVRLLVSDAWGIYVPQRFIQDYDPSAWGIAHVTMPDPDQDGYWDEWDYILSIAKHVDSDGITWHLYQDGDLFAVAYDAMTDDQYREFFGEDRV